MTIAPLPSARIAGCNPSKNRPANQLDALGNVILLESVLIFLGLGLQPPVAS